MNKISLTCCLFLLLTIEIGHTQNAGIGILEPKNKLHVLGNILINEPYTATTTPPTPAQTKTMINNGTINFAFSDSTGRFFDPGGPAGNYISNLIGYAVVDGGIGIGIEVTIESIGLGTGDSLILRNYSGSPVLFAVGNGYNTSGKWIFQEASLYATFKSNGDGNNGIGFSILFRRLVTPPGVQPDVSGFVGNAFFFDTKNAALRFGYLDPSPRGYCSLGSGFLPNATNYYSVAMGQQTNASGFSSTAFGGETIASGSYSTAMGQLTIASGSTSTAMGANNTAGGNLSTAIGLNNKVFGNYSTVIGTKMEIYASQPGSFSVGDYESSIDPIQVTGGAGTNSFTARFRGGYYFLTSQNAPGGNFANRTGVTCATGQNSWSAWSDVNRKENFLPVDGELFLKKIAAMPQYTWNYKAQSPKEFRHYGPMAQDIFNAFGKDEFGTIGNDTMINQQDLLGIEFISIQALEKRTSELQVQLSEAFSIIKSLQSKVEWLEKKNSNEDNLWFIKSEEDE